MYFSYSQVFLCLPGTELSKSQRNLCNDSLSSAATCFFFFFFLMFLRQELHILISLQPCMFTESALALETGGAANETPSFLIVFLVKPRLINAAKFPVCEQSTSGFRRADDSQRSAAPSHRAERTFGSRWSRSASENWLPECFCSSLCPMVPTDTGTDRRRGLSCSQRTMRETGRSGGGMKALKFLMRSLVFSLLNLHTSCLWAGWNNQAHHATHTDKLPPLALAHPSVCHHSRRVPRPCFCGDMRNSVSPPPLFFLCLSSAEVGRRPLKASRGLLSRKIDLLHINILHLSSIWKRSPRQCRRPAAGEELARCLLCGWGIYSLSGLHVVQSCVCARNDTPPPHPTPPQPRRHT